MTLAVRTQHMIMQVPEAIGDKEEETPHSRHGSRGTISRSLTSLFLRCNRHNSFGHRKPCVTTAWQLTQLQVTMSITVDAALQFPPAVCSRHLLSRA